MTLARSSLVAVLVVSCLLVPPSAARAQPLGTFRWQQKPYCNVFTLNVVQAGALYQVDGHDDQCGAGTHAAVVGLALPNPNGSIGFGLTVVTTPGGTPLHVDATIDPASLGGTWRDSSGATGAWTFAPGGSSGGSARPSPRAAFPAGLSAGNATITNVAAPVAGTDAATKNYVDANSTSDRAYALDLATRAVHIGAYTIVPLSGSILPLSGGCVSVSSGSTVALDVPVPRGAVLTSAQVAFFQFSPQENATFRLYGKEPGLSGIPSGTFSTLGTPNGGHSQTWTFPAGLTPVSAVRSYYMHVTVGTVSAFQVCGIDVNYTLP